MTPEHKYIAERFERRTYIKGTFKGTFVGQLDPVKSDNNYDRFYDLEIIEGNISTTQDNVSKWPASEESIEFTTVSRFLTRPGEVRVALQYLDGSLKHFKIKLHELKLINCRLSKQIHKGNEVIGTIEGDVSGYVLHYDSTIEEIPEIKAAPVFAANDDEQPEAEQKKQSSERIKKITDYLNIRNRSEYDPYKKTGCLPLFSWLFWIALISGFFVIFNHVILTIVFLLAGLLLASRTYKWMAGRFNWRISVRSITAIYIILCSSVLALLIWSARHDKKEKLLADTLMADTQNYNATQQKINRQNKDSFNHHLNAGKTLEARRKYEPALNSFQRAAAFASAAEQKLLADERAATLKSQAGELVKQVRYSEAISAYTQFVALTSDDADVFYKRAQCYVANGKMQEAVTDLKKAIAMGDKPALLLHEKINPIKKRIVDVVTLCNDGTYSNAKGRGACSHHGGVRDWNHEIYEEYRVYK